MNERSQRWSLSARMGQAYGWKNWCKRIPFLKFPPDWAVRIVPPFAGAIVRFEVEKAGKYISVYLDGFNMLGMWNGPYWEAYPINSDTYRVDMKDTEKLIDAIRGELERL